MSFSPLIRQLIDSLRILPGVGQKTAQRMALQLLERDRSGGQRLAQALNAAMEGVGPVSYTHLSPASTRWWRARASGCACASAT